MASFARIDENNVVTSVISVSNDVLNNLPFPESESLGIAFLTDWSGGYSNWKQSSYNGNFRKHHAGIGYSYNQDIDAFVPPQPFPSWTLNTDTALWEPPVPYPSDGKQYKWNEETISWIEITGA